MSLCNLCPLVILYTLQFYSLQLRSVPCIPTRPCRERGTLSTKKMRREIEKLTREIHPRHDKCIASAPVDFLFDAPSVSLSLDFYRTITIPTSIDLIDESFASSSSYILWQE